MGVLDGARALVDADDRAAYNAAIESLRTRPGAHAVVVVGEVGAGKSSLVNALLGADLSPVGAVETTGTYLRFVPPGTPPDELAAGRARVDFPDGRRVDIGAERLGDWVVIGGAALEADEGEFPSGAAAGADSALPGVVIVDTPGSGGVDPAHARVAIASAERASVLLLVTDAGGRITEPALAFLDACAEHADAIVVAVNQIDKLPGWEIVLEENTRLLHERDPRYASVAVLGVSAQLANQARLRERPESRERLYAASGMEALLEALRERLARADRIPAARAVRQVHRLLARELAEAQGRLAALDVDDDGAARLEADRRRLELLQEKDAKWRRWLNRQFAMMGDQVTDLVRTRTDEYAASWHERITKHLVGISKTKYKQMQAEMEVEANYLYLQIDDQIRARVTAIAEELFASVDLGDFSEAIFGEEGIPADARGLPPIVRREGKADLDPGLLSASFMGGTMISVVAPFLAPVGIAGMLAVNLLSRGGLKNKRDATAHAERMVPRIRETAGARLNRVLWEYRDEIEDVFAKELARVGKALAAEVAAAAKARQLSAEQLETERAELGTRIAALEAQLERGSREVRRLIWEPVGTSVRAAASDEARKQDSRTN
ncbi:MAG: dynamin family protein [Microbacteriaceae bacterium]|nr:dynamin family protein [Microbacteriaceae bacterium]